MQKMREVVLHYFLVLWLVMSGITRGSPNVPDGCHDKCGEVSIVYPFGLEEPKCAFGGQTPFLLKCDNSTSPPSLVFRSNRQTFNISDISVEDGLISVKNIKPASLCDNETTPEAKQQIDLGDKLFRLSSEYNKLTILGCNSLGYIEDSNFVTGCLSLCNKDVNFSESNCSDIGCCQAAVPHSLRSLTYYLETVLDNSNVSGINPCGYAFLADSRTFSFDFNLSDVTADMIYKKVKYAIEWVVEQKTCEEANRSASYACRDNAKCDYSKNGKGYRCLCKEGFAGNPYLPTEKGCIDIDECKDQSKYHCEGTCENTIGDYTCKCPFWMHGDGKNSCQVSRATKTVTVVGPLLLIGVIGFLIVIMLKKRRKTKNFLRNGGKLLEHQRVRIFSDAELTKATKNYDKSNFLGEGGFGSVYKGKLQDGTQVAVKKPKDFNKTHINEDFQHEIGIISQINHKNVVKILGICLETKIPLLVYEFVSNGSLDRYLHHQISFVRNWENCLRIAAEAALAFEYLHSLASPPVIHGDVKPANILLDKYYTAKVADFGASTIISPDHRIMASKIQGTLGYMDPEYLTTGDLTEKSDVYSFGVVLVELLTGEKPNAVAKWGGKTTMQYFHSSLEANKLNQMLCFVVNSEDEMEEIQKFANLAKDCLCSIGDQRPTMKEVAEALGKLMEKIRLKRVIN